MDLVRLSLSKEPKEETHALMARDGHNWVCVALSNSMLRRCQIEVKYAEGDADSVKSDAGGIISATRVAQTLHGDTTKNYFCKSHAGY